MDLNRWVVLIGIVVAYFVISMFMDEIPLLLLTLQLTFPLVTSLGFDPVWFGVLSMMMVAMGLVFPPVGLIAFVVSATAGVDLMKVYKGTSILMLALVATTVLLMIFPDIALITRDSMLGGVKSVFGSYDIEMPSAVSPSTFHTNASGICFNSSVALLSSCWLSRRCFACSEGSRSNRLLYASSAASVCADAGCPCSLMCRFTDPYRVWTTRNESPFASRCTYFHRV